MKYILTAFLLLFTANLFAQYAEVTPRLQQQVQGLNPTQYVRTLILLRDRVDIETLDAQLYSSRTTAQQRAPIVITALQEKARQTQGPLLSFLREQEQMGKVKQLMNFWITNLIFAEVTPDVIQKLAMRTDIELMDLDALLTNDQPTDFTIASDQLSMAAETGLKAIKADELWKRGFTGAGRMVMNIDGGVAGTHAALSSKWRGNNGSPWYHSWFDPISPISQAPFDCGSHGTHTMGIMCGMVPGDTVGVAPDARWMAAGITDCPGASYPSMNVAAFQWAMNPDSNVSTNDMPDVISCSWQDPSQAGSTQCTGIYIALLNSVEAVGTAVVFSAGNSGPGASTITPPKNLSIDSVTTFAVGNINGSTAGFPINSSSSRGPSICGGTGTLLIKPEVVAPGTTIRSTIPSGYGNMTGTSMASPHVGGSIALLRQVDPTLTGKQIKAILFTTATDLGTAGEDNTYGRGIINLLAAFQYMGPSIQHTQLPNTENLAGPYTVNTVISSATSLTSVKLFWGRGAITDSVVMTNSSGNTWTANIPGNGSTAQYRYYISVRDSLSRVKTAPASAPTAYYSFNAAVDNSKPVIIHTALANVPKNLWPATVNATVKDNLGLDSVWVKWYRNTPSPIRHFRLNALNDTTYRSPFNSDTSQVSIGDTIKYRIFAQDIAAAHNRDSSALFQFVITTVTGITPVSSYIPEKYSLAQNYPNPFNPVTSINFGLPVRGLVNIKVYDITGKEIAVLVNEVKAAGIYSVSFNGAGLSSGIYFYRIMTESFVETRRMVLAK
jgi:hypothetical protein